MHSNAKFTKTQRAHRLAALYDREPLATVTAPKGCGGRNRRGGGLRARLATDPNWNGGWYYENGGIGATLEAMRYETLVNYGQLEVLRRHPGRPRRARGGRARQRARLGEGL